MAVPLVYEWLNAYLCCKALWVVERLEQALYKSSPFAIYMYYIISSLAEWCTENNILLNVSKTKELIVYFRKKGGRDILAPPL